MKFLVFLLSLLALVTSFPTTVSPCPTGFSLLNDQICVKLIDTPRLYQDALTSCKSYPGGNLISIHNAIDNRALVNLANQLGTFTPIWVGLTCASLDPTSCSWEDGTGTSQVYNNFWSGNPQVSNGLNVYMLPSKSSSGKWVSADGATDVLSYFCEVPKTPTPGDCPNELNGQCYSFNENLLFEEDARSYCQEQCGDLVSIHSQQENDHVFSLFSSGFNQIWIGAMTDGSNGKYWSDGSYYDYSNYGDFTTGAGKCSTMQSTRGLFGDGQWNRNGCFEKNPFVCKWLKNFRLCSSSFNPNLCYGTHSFNGTGTMISPNYPNSYFGMATPCTYIFTAPIGHQAQIQFPQLNLDDGSSISLYSGADETIPIVQLTGSSAPSKQFISKTNVLKMVFQNGQSHFDPSTAWVASYGSSV
uniref:C-type LECtin n=1 Tax=Caenorhabditis tropicalis TaxID=1561998 RepID=A0A1I7T6F6_9PELO